MQFCRDGKKTVCVHIQYIHMYVKPPLKGTSQMQPPPLTGHHCSALFDTPHIDMCIQMQHFLQQSLNTGHPKGLYIVGLFDFQCSLLPYSKPKLGHPSFYRISSVTMQVYANQNKNCNLRPSLKLVLRETLVCVYPLYVQYA